jgi:hypothetical protein
LRNTVNVTGGKLIAVWLQLISGVNAIYTLVAFYDIHGRNRDVLIFYFVPDTTRDLNHFGKMWLSRRNIWDASCDKGRVVCISLLCFNNVVCSKRRFFINSLNNTDLFKSSESLYIKLLWILIFSNTVVWTHRFLKVTNRTFNQKKEVTQKIL